MQIEDAFRKFGPALLAHASVLVGPADADDLVSDAIVGALRSSGWLGVVNHEAYLQRAVANAAYGRHRSASRTAAREWRVALVDLPPEAEYLPRPEVVEAVRGLSLQQRSVVYFTFWEDRTGAEVADLLNISEGSVRQHLARAKDRLRKVLL